MGIFRRLFSGLIKDKPSDKPPIYGGDGLSKESPAIVNCASMSMAQGLMDRFISEKCGENWERGVELTLASRDDPDKNIKMVSVELPDGTENQFYFDLSRPVDVSLKMYRRAGQNESQIRTHPKPKRQDPVQEIESSLPCEIHDNDRDLVKQSDIDWWRSLEVSDVMEMEQIDNAFKLAAYKKFRDEGLDGHEAAKKVRVSFLVYYGRTKDRRDPRFKFSEQDVSLPYALKKRIDDSIASGAISKEELRSETSINAAIRRKIRSGEL